MGKKDRVKKSKRDATPAEQGSALPSQGETEPLHEGVVRYDSPDSLEQEEDVTTSSLARKIGRISATRAEASGDSLEHHFDFSYTQNREISWLRFDDRVLDEACDATVPLFERMKFCSIFQSNLDEWFMIRVGGLSDLATLKHQPVDNKSDETPAEQLDTIFKTLPPMLVKFEATFHAIEGALSGFGLVRVDARTMNDQDLVAVSRYFDAEVSPILSPMVVDPRHPFPNLRNGMLYVMCSLDGPEERGVLGMVEVPPALPRVVALPAQGPGFRYILMEDIILAKLSAIFGQYSPTSSAVMRVTRNADIDPDGEGVEEEEDYRQHMKKVLKKRLRLAPVRLEMEGALDPALHSFVCEELGLEERRCYRLGLPLDLSYVYGIESNIPEDVHASLVFEPFEPQRSPMVDPTLPMRRQVEDHDIMLFYPYESMGPLLDLLHEAASDDDCISLKITLYRVAKQSRLCESLISAAENGKDVTVLMELRARFDEANNIAWAERLESAGCTVIYGSEGFKCHSKICQITYHEEGRIRRITCLGTGNFNEKTARLYSDFMLLTAHDGIAEDGNAFFRNLSLGNLRGVYKYLGVAPAGLKPLIMRGLDREITRARAEKPAQVFMKMNSLTDRDVIDKLAEACQAGVRVMLVIRGICCIRANIPGKTDGLEVHQIVGRLLEHSRCYAFGAEVDTIYLSSADMMTRNTERRVEIAYPVLDPTCRAMVIQYMNLQLADTAKARLLTSQGTWEPIPVGPGEPRFNSQETLIAVAYQRSATNQDETGVLSPVASMPSIPHELAVRLNRLDATIESPQHPVEMVTIPIPEPQVEVQPASAELPQPQAKVETEEQDAGNAAEQAVSVISVPLPKVETEPEYEVESKAEAETEAKVETSDEDVSKAKPQAEEEAEPEVEAEHQARVETQAQTKPEPVPEHVEAHLIDEQPSTSPAAPASQDAAGENVAQPAATSTTAIERRRPGRLATGLALIGLGLKTIFGRGPKKG